MTAALRFKRIKVANVGVIREQQVDLGPLSPGVNVIGGPNECGKSSIVRALRAALFLRHGSAHESIKSLKPYDSKLGPSVELEFTMDDREYVLEKQFLSKPRAHLRAIDGSIDLTGDDADTWLVNALDGQEAPKKGINPDTMGVWGLLWVQQDEFAAGEPTSQIGKHQRASLAQAIEQQVGNVMGGQHGLRLREAIDLAYEKYWTPKQNDRATGDLLKAREAVERLTRDVAERQKQVDETVTLGNAQVVAEADIADRMAGESGLERELVECERLAREADGIVAQHKTVEQSLKDARDASMLAREAQARRKTLRAGAARAVERETSGGDEVERVRSRARVALVELERTEGLRTEAKKDQESAERNLEDVSRRLEEGRQREDLARKESALAQARTLEEEIRVCEHEIVGLPDASTLTAIQDMDQRRSAYERQVAKRATRVLVASPGHDPVEHLVPRRTTVDLGGIGSVTIDPPREGFTAARMAHHKTLEALSERLGVFKLATVAEARTASERRVAAETQRGALEAQLKALAPRGMDALATEAQRAESDHTQSERTLNDATEQRDAVARFDQQIAAITIRPADLRTLDDLDAHLRRLASQSAHARVHVTVRPLEDIRVQLGATDTPRMLSRGAEVRRPITAITRFVIDDRVEIDIDPGATDGPSVDDLEPTRTALSVALAAFDLASVDDARAAVAEHAKIETLRDLARRRVEELAPKGVGNLGDEVLRLGQKADKTRGALADARKRHAELAVAERAVAHDAPSKDQFAELDALDRRGLDEEQKLLRLAGQVVASAGPIAEALPVGEDLVDIVICDVDGVHVEILPGDVPQDLELPVLERELARALARVGASTVDEAVRAHVRREKLVATRDEKQAELRRIDPRGIVALETDVVRLRAVVGGSAPVDASIESLEISRDQGTRRLEKARVRSAEVTALVERAQREVATVQRDLSVAEGAFGALAIERAVALESLRLEESTATDETLDERVRATHDAETAAEHMHESASRALDAARPDERHRDVERQVLALTAHRKRTRELQDEYERRKGALETILPLGRYDALVDKQTELEGAVDERARVERVASSFRLLRDMADQAYTGAQEKLMAPVYKEAMPLLRSILPNTTFTMDDGTLELQKIHRHDHDEDFEMLSGGTREQLGLVIRVALAKVFARQRRAMPLILDDILGWTDDTRLRGMINVLENTAREMQVIVLTCHPDRFARFLGATRFDLTTLKTPLP